MQDKIMGDFKKWLAKPSDGHIVDFYSSKEALVASILEYMTSGLDEGDYCILIAKPVHIQMLNKESGKHAAKIREQLRDGCRTFNAQSVLEQFMLNGLPDKKKFFKVLATILSEAKKQGRPIRVYGEMVAVLLEEHNTEGAIQLEKLWNELAKIYSFSLYCAYPEGAIKMSGDDTHNTINSYHDFKFGSHINI